MANVPSEFYTSGLNTWDQFANAIELSCQHSTSLEKEFPIPCNDLSVASERFLVTIDKVCRVWNLKTGEVLLTFNERRILKVLIKESQLILSYLKKITENNENFLQPQEGLNNNSKNEFDVNSTLERWNIENQELISSYQSSIGKVIHMKLHQSQLLCISVNQDREIWDLKSNIAQVIRLSDKKAVKKIKLEYPYLALEIDGFNRHQLDGEILVYTVPNNHRITQLNFSNTSIDFWDFAAYKLVAASGNKIEIKDIKTSAEIWISTSERIQRLKIAQNKIAALSRSGVLTLFNLEDGKSLRRIRDEQKIEKFLYNENLLITQSASCIKFCLVGPKGIECKSIIKKKDARKVKLFSNQFIVLSKDKVHIFRVSADV